MNNNERPPLPNVHLENLKTSTSYMTPEYEKLAVETSCSIFH